MGIEGIEELSNDTDSSIAIGDIVIDNDNTEWVIVGISHTGLSRVRRNSLAHEIHAQGSPEIAKTLIK